MFSDPSSAGAMWASATKRRLTIALRERCFSSSGAFELGMMCCRVQW